jgi:hypothetical protein
MLGWKDQEPKKVLNQFKLRCMFNKHAWLRMDRDFWRCKNCGKIKTNAKVK